MRVKILFILLFLGLSSTAFAKPKVELGIDLFFKEGHADTLKNKRVGLIVNQTSVNSELKTTVELFKLHSKNFKIVALFSPEHGQDGIACAGEHIEHSKMDNIPIYSLFCETRKPTDQMLKNIDVLIFDIQEIGVRSYSYASTLFYCMEAAAKNEIEVIVLDRPNPMGGLVVDGPMLEDKWRSFLGYIDVPYCHGMTIGELADFFNEEYEVGCDLTIVQMKGWSRAMTFRDTGLPWIPTSRYIPEDDTPFFYASTGILGVLGLVNIGIGYTLPFKVIGAPWINAETFTQKLNNQNLHGVHFFPFHYKPIYGFYKDQDCHGVLILVTDPTAYRPASVQYLMIGMLKTLYPDQVKKYTLDKMNKQKKKLFCQLNGNDEMLDILLKEKYPAWKLINFDKEKRKAFQKKRERYLLY